MKINTTAIEDFADRNSIDILIFIGLFIAGLLLTLYLSGQMNPLITDPETFNSWFEADTPRYFENFTNRESDYSRTEVHPIFPLITYFPVLALRKLLGLDPWLAVRVLDSLTAGLWVGMLYSLLRALKIKPEEAILFSGVGLVSSASLFFLTVPESYPYGSIAMMLALLLAALHETRQVAPGWYSMVGVLTLGTTVTNWMASLLASFIRFTRKTALQISSNTFSIVVILWAVQKYFFPSSKFFLGGAAAVQREVGFIDFSRSGGLLTSAKAFLFHSMVMPQIEIVNLSEKADWLEMSVQRAAPGSGGTIGLIAVIAWTLLLTAGIWSLFNMGVMEKFRLTTGLLLAGQFGLHLFYGNETILYSLHYLPVMLIPAALASKTRWRNYVLAAAVVLLVTAAINNYQQFQFAMAFFDQGLGAP